VSGSDFAAGPAIARTRLSWMIRFWRLNERTEDNLGAAAKHPNQDDHHASGLLDYFPAQN
jgi:hypothetical protein